MEFVQLHKDDKVISARSDMVGYYESQGWVIPGSDLPSKGVEPSAPSQPTKPAPSIAEIRSWALETGITGVSERGKLPKHAVQAYLQAHKD